MGTTLARPIDAALLRITNKLVVLHLQMLALFPHLDYQWLN
jgi:hypothetical protein